MKIPFTGGCLCGAIRYECHGEPMFPGFCHCRNCQKLSGTAFATAFAVPTEALKITGNVTYYETMADSGHTSRSGFCPKCGSRVFGDSTGMPGLSAIMAGSLDEPGDLRPGMHIFAARAQPWVRIDPDLPTFPGMPSIADMG